MSVGGFQASPASQGVYFCFDELSTGITNLFYVLLAMVPPVSIFDSEHLSEEQKNNYGNDCSNVDSKHILPSINWRFHYQPTFHDKKPSSCTKGTLCYDYKTMPVKVEHQRGNHTKPCTLEGCSVRVPPVEMPNSLYDPGLDIELRWEAWTSCEGNVRAQRREAHCFIVARHGFTVDEDLEDVVSHIEEFKWIVKLGQLVHSDAFRKKGVRLYSSSVWSSLYRKDLLTGCGEVEEGILIAVMLEAHLKFRIEKFRLRTVKFADDVWRKYFLAPMGVVTTNGKHLKRDEDIKFRLQNPFQACLRYEKSAETNELLVGTYMVETRDCA
ncbi:hypothetical protein RB195_017845 [Necator americanus]|uniref:Uncharacterized protein n=1 Tax=Necator americanus TaxID=51031 RepID=A0ABR1C721_NECAM